MQFEVIGGIALLLGLWGLVAGADTALTILCVAGVFGASAAFKLPAMGDASIPPSHLLLVFLVLQCLRDAAIRRFLLETVAFPRAGFWFLLAVGYALATAYLLPRLFAGETLVYLIARSPMILINGITIETLAPRSSNITQAVYMLGNLACFAAVSAMVMNGGARTVTTALLAAAGCHVLLAGIDMAGYATGAPDLLSYLRNGNYRMLADTEVKGFKRIVGGFSETSAYTYVALGFYAFTLQLWLRDVRSALTGFLTVTFALIILFSTSSGAYVTFALYNLVAYVGSFRRMRRMSRHDLLFLGAGPIALGLLVMGMMLIPAIWDTATALVDSTLTRKLESSSGVERATWNLYAMRSFVDTFGLGAGLGSIRTSSFLVALFSNVGVVGALLYGLYLACALFGFVGGGAPARDPDQPIRHAARSACLAILIAASLSVGSIDLGLFFMMFSALATTRAWSPRRVEAPAGAAASRPLAGAAVCIPS